jgi:hypothetical protein
MRNRGSRLRETMPTKNWAERRNIMKQISHSKVTYMAFQFLKPPKVGHLHLEQWWLGDDSYRICVYAYKTDEMLDMEFVNVEGGIGSGGRDDPHKDETWKADDVPHKSEMGVYFTSFNHFIDIRKYEGIFDDFDGYSYRRGSGSTQELQKASDALAANATPGSLQNLLAFICLHYLDLLGADITVDEAINWWYNDEYVHAPGHKWYRRYCSQAVERYSFYQDKGIYSSVEEEAKKRFPRASSTGQDGQGIPYSVFMPVDNLARYWFSQYEQLRETALLGYVAHAIQDASIPHHTAGCLGNWHAEYEAKLEEYIGNWLFDEEFKNEVIELYKQWSENGDNPPISLNAGHWNLTPSSDWRIDHLVTWVALHAYRSFVGTYHSFSDGFTFNEADAKELTKKATAVTMLALKKANDLGGKTRYAPPWRFPR